MLQRCRCQRCCTVVSLHRWHTKVAATAVTVLSRSLLSQHNKVRCCHNTVTTTDVTLLAYCHCCDIHVSVDNSATVNLNRCATVEGFLMYGVGLCLDMSCRILSCYMYSMLCCFVRCVVLSCIVLRFVMLYIPLISWVRGQYGKVMDRIFPFLLRPKRESRWPWKYGRKNEDP